MRGVLLHSPPFAHVTKKSSGLNWEYQIAAGNAGWRSQFRYRGGRHPPRVAELGR